MAPPGGSLYAISSALFTIRWWAARNPAVSADSWATSSEMGGDVAFSATATRA